MEFIQIKGNTWCLKGWSMIPVYRVDERRCILLDSGWTWEREALQEVLERENLLPIAVIGSHAHEDHSGNHTWLKETYGARICMTAGEAALGRSLAMFKMVYPALSRDMLEDFVGEMNFPTDQIIGSEDGVEEVCGVSFRIHQTPGHTPEHICVGTPDGVCYLGDLLLSEDLCPKAQLPFHLLHWMNRASMEKMKGVEGYSHFVASHKGVSEDIVRLVDVNLERLDWICEQMLGLMEEPVTWEELMKKIIDRNRLYTSDPIKVVGYEASTQPFVDYLKETGRLTIKSERGRRYFQRT